MPVTRLINVNGDGGAFTAIVATIPSHTVQLVEDASVTGQGLQVQFPGDGYATTDTYPAGQPVELQGHGHDGLLGYSAGGTSPAAAAATYCLVRSATANATTVRVVEREA